MTAATSAERSSELEPASGAFPISDAARLFHSHLPADYAGALLDSFHRAARAGHDTPGAVVVAVVHEVGNRLGRVDPHTPHADALNALLAALGQEPDGAREYADAVLAWNALPPEERAGRKEAQAAAYRQQRMTELEPTQKQLDFLRTLGDPEAPPQNRAEASRRIDALNQQRAARRRQTAFGEEVRQRAGLTGMERGR